MDFLFGLLFWRGKDRELASITSRTSWDPGHETFIQQNARLERGRGRLLLHVGLDSFRSDIDIKQLMYCFIVVSLVCNIMQAVCTYSSKPIQ
jgi:hypothetical protein